MKVTATQLRGNIYNILGRLYRGNVEITHKGKTVAHLLETNEIFELFLETCEERSVDPEKYLKNQMYKFIKVGETK